MGSPLGPFLLAPFYVYMKFFGLKDVFEFRQLIYKSYVDCIFLLFQNVNRIEKFKHHLKFTSEIDMNNLLSFLDVRIVKELLINSLPQLTHYIQWCFF